MAEGGLSDEYDAWQCEKHGGYCPREGCPTSHGCARDRGWKPGMKTDGLTGTVLREPIDEDRRDAERWRALMSSQRFHIMAMTGFTLHHRDGDEANRSKANLEPVPIDDVPMFIKMEFWSEYEDRPFKDAFERELMERYADAIIERREKANGKGRDNSNEVHMRPLQADADL